MRQLAIAAWFQGCARQRQAAIAASVAKGSFLSLSCCAPGCSWAASVSDTPACRTLSTESQTRLPRITTREGARPLAVDRISPVTHADDRSGNSTSFLWTSGRTRASTLVPPLRHGSWRTRAPFEEKGPGGEVERTLFSRPQGRSVSSPGYGRAELENLVVGQPARRSPRAHPNEPQSGERHVEPSEGCATRAARAR